jgi:PBP1b-binding outer membrane lipoprotein LpoB
MKNIKFTLLLLVVILVQSCAKVYNAPEANALSARHKTIAVLAPKVIMPAAKGQSAADLETASKNEGELFQQKMINWLLKRKGDGKFTVDIMDGTTTSIKLKNMGNTDLIIPADQGKGLGVDGVLVSRFKLTKPMSTGAAIATSILFGFGVTNEAIMNMELHDINSGKVIWTFEHRVSGGLLNSADGLIDEVMRVASKKLPYLKSQARK